ncbi:MAG TPA: hypothetical protein VEL07_15955 [Planctomycetota bacterium]|nr:hypothetical protein [Planctomycetota bacterium]
MRAFAQLAAFFVLVSIASSCRNAAARPTDPAREQPVMVEPVVIEVAGGSPLSADAPPPATVETQLQSHEPASAP